MTSNPQAAPFEQRLERIERLVHEIEQSSDAAAQNAARELVHTILDLHAAGLAKMIELLREAESGRGVLEAWTEDELVRNLLVLHDLHPEDVAARVRQALEQVRPYLHSHGGGVELLEASAEVVRLRLEGACQGCPSSAATIRSTIEQAIYAAAPEVMAIDVEGITAPAAPLGLVQLHPAISELSTTPAPPE